MTENKSRTSAVKYFCLKKISPLGLAILSGILLWAAWPMSPLTPIIFFAFVPLFWAADLTNRKRFFGLTYLCMFTWNLLTTWWIVNASLVGAAMAMVANSFMMCLPWWGYHIFKNKFSRRTAYFAFVCFWMAFEYLHLNWQLSWPWLNLGNVFANQTDWVQWYEYTGIGGGTLWVLVVNVMIYDWLLGGGGKPTRYSTVVGIVFVIAIPIVASFVTFGPMLSVINYAPPTVVIVQPNIDPYGKFNQASVDEQIQTLIGLSEKEMSNDVTLVLWPETALSSLVAVDEIESKPEYGPVFEFLKRHPTITLLTGIETFRWYGAEKPRSPYARKHPSGVYYDSYNAAISLKAGQPIQLYIKSKLVPGVETLPTFLNFLGPVFEQFGGTTGGYAKDSASIVFKNEGNPYVTAPIICYESIYGEYVASYVQKGANLLTIITNDGWWGNTPGHKQHLHYARLRAIETRTYIARSANTGISAIIDEEGNIIETKPWDVASAIKALVPITNPPTFLPKPRTFYVKHGDYLYKGLSLLAGLLVLWNIANLIFGRVRKG